MAFLVPVGHDLGPRLLAGDDPRFQIRLGSRIVELDGVRFAIWLLAHDGTHRAPDRGSVLDAAAEAGLDRTAVAAGLAGLLADGLVVELEPDPAAVRSFAEAHQLFPLMVGLGPDSGSPDLCVVGLLDLPVLQLSTRMYELWLWAHLRPNLWLACGEVEPGRMLAEALPALFPLLASRAAYVDQVAA